MIPNEVKAIAVWLWANFDHWSNSEDCIEPAQALYDYLKDAGYTMKLEN